MSHYDDRRYSDEDAYTGETIVMRRPGAPPPPEPPPVPPPAPPSRRRAKPPRRIWPRIRLALLLLLIGLAIGVGLLYWQVVRVAQVIVVPDARPNPTIASPLLGGMNLLLVGVDERPDNPEEGVRSDTLILARMDALSGYVGLLSVPRDTQVDMIDIGATKINVAYGQGFARAEELYGPGTTPQQGGMALAAQTVGDFLQLSTRGQRVHYTAQVNFAGFANVIDALGGITIDVPVPIVDDEYPTPDFGITRIEFAPGVQTMDGQRALIYARTRHADSDFGRAERQQQVLRAIISEFQSRNLFQKVLLLPTLLDSIAGDDGSTPPVLTTLPVARPDVLLGMLIIASNLNPDEIGQVQISPENVAVTEIGSNLLWDPDGVRAQVDTWLTPPSEATERATVQVYNGVGVAGLASQITSELEQAGFTVFVAGDAPPGDYERTVIYNRTNKPRTSSRVARTLNAEVQNGEPPGIVSEADIVVVLGNDTN